MNHVFAVVIGVILGLTLVLPGIIIIRGNDIARASRLNCESNNDIKAAVLIMIGELIAVTERSPDHGALVTRFEKLSKTLLVPIKC